MKSLAIIAGFLAAMALATPTHHNHHHLNRRRVHPQRHHQEDHQVEKRKIHTKWITETAWVTETVYMTPTSTKYLGAEATPDKSEDKESDAKADEDAQFHEVPAPTPPAKKPASPPPAPPAPVPVAPAPSAAPPAAAPSPPENPIPNKGAESSGGYDKSGEMTYYAVGLGACGWNDAGKGQTDYIVAMNAPLMGAQSNGNPMCGKKVEISYNGKTIVAEVRDKCPECAPGDLDVSEGAFVALCGGTGAGRVKIDWKFLN